MKERKAFIGELKAYAKENGLAFHLDRKKGKGSHYRVRLGEKTATVPKRVTPTLRKIIRKQLGMK